MKYDENDIAWYNLPEVAKKAKMHKRGIKKLVAETTRERIYFWLIDRGNGDGRSLNTHSVWYKLAVKVRGKRDPLPQMNAKVDYPTVVVAPLTRVEGDGPTRPWSPLNVNSVGAIEGIEFDETGHVKGHEHSQPIEKIRKTKFYYGI